MILSKLCSPLLRHAMRAPRNLALRAGTQQARLASGKRVLRMFRSKHMDHEWRKYLAIYTAIGVIPAALVVFFTSAIIGEAELYDYDPDLYEPEYWEFYSHPIARFLAKYVMEDPKMSYYKDIYAIEFEDNHSRSHRLVRQVDEIERAMGREAARSNILQANWSRVPNPMHLEKLDKYAEEHGIERYRDDGEE